MQESQQRTENQILDRPRIQDDVDFFGEEKVNVTQHNARSSSHDDQLIQPEPGQQNGSRPWPVIVTRHLVKTYILGETNIYALRGVSIKVYSGEFVAIMGPSGSGKSSFMNLIGCLDHPTSGGCFLAGMPVSRLRPDDLADIRNMQPRGRGVLIGANFRTALKALRTNQLRSFLTTLGVIIGVAAVIAIVTLTQGVSATLNQRLAGLGTNVLMIQSGSASRNGAFQGEGTAQTLTMSDVQALSTIPHVANISPVISVGAQAIYGNRNWNTQVQGVYPGYQSLQNWQLARGTWFSTGDQLGAAPVAVIGQTVVDNLFTPAGIDPIGQTIRINNQLFRVVGTLQSKGSQGFGNADDVIFVPSTAAQDRLKNSLYVDQIQIQVDSSTNVAQVQQNVTTALEKQHHIAASATDDFRVLNANQLLQTAQQTTTLLTALLVGIAAISLTVGGIRRLLPSRLTRTRLSDTRTPPGS